VVHLSIGADRTTREAPAGRSLEASTVLLVDLQATVRDGQNRGCDPALINAIQAAIVAALSRFTRACSFFVAIWYKHFSGLHREPLI
jgi:hypothetical protein